MAVDVAKQPLPCTQAEYKYFKNIYEGFCYLTDHKNEQSNSIYSYKQTEVFENLVEFWPTIEAMCKALKVPLTVTLQDIECIFSGFDAGAITALYKNERYVGIARKKIIAMEEYRLLHMTKSLFDTLMVRLHRTFRKCTKTDIEPCKVKWQKVPIIDIPKTKKEKSNVITVAKGKTPPKQPPETLAKTDSDILQAMSENPEANMIRVEIETSAGYGKDAVTNSLKRLETMGFVCRPYDAKRKGWTLTEKGAATTKNLRH